MRGSRPGKQGGEGQEEQKRESAAFHGELFYGQAGQSVAPGFAPPGRGSGLLDEKPRSALPFLPAFRLISNAQRIRFRPSSVTLRPRSPPLIPRREDLERLLRSSEGRIEETPFAVLLLAHAVHSHTAVIELRRPPVSKKIVLETGVPVDCRSNLAHETLGRFMVAAGRISEEEFHSALSQTVAQSVPLGEVLIERGLIGGEELFRLLQQNLAKKLLDLFTWRQGEFRVSGEPPTAESPLKVRVPQLIATGIIRFAPQEEVDAAIAPLVGKHLALSPDPFFAASELKLTTAQQKLSDALRTPRQLHELVEATGLPLDEIARLLYALCLLGSVVALDRPPAGRTGAIPIFAPPPPSAPTPPPPPAASAPPAPELATRQVPIIKLPPPPPPAPAVSGASERRRNELMQIYLAHRRLDPFDLLGLPEDAAPPLIDARFFEFAERSAPWSFAGTDLEEKARELFSTGARAYAQLVEAESRGTLLFRRRTLREERERRPDPDRFKIKTDLLDPEAQFRKALSQLEAGRTKEAIQLLEFAADCDPGNGLYRAELAYARFSASPGAPSVVRRSALDLKEALRVDPRCGLAALYLGEVAGALGELDEAEAALRQAIRLMAPDRRPIEALKTLQGRRKR